MQMLIKARFLDVKLLQEWNKRAIEHNTDSLGKEGIAPDLCGIRRPNPQKSQLPLDVPYTGWRKGDFQSRCTSYVHITVKGK